MVHVEPSHDANDVMSNSIVARLAGKICDFDKAALTKNALAQAKARILDTIGVTLAGVPEPCTQILLRTPGVATAPGLSLIFGTNRRTSALDATLVNGIASRALDDPSGTAGGHHSGPLVSMLFALAEERKGRGDDLIAAYVIGAETETRLARAVNFHDPDSRRPISMPGTLAAAAAACHFLKFGQERMATALVIAASLASGSRDEAGALTKPLHAGQCARNGLLAAFLAEQGFDAAADAFEHLQGFVNVDVERLFADGIAPLEIGAALGDNPMNYSESLDKFEDYAARALPREQIAVLFERLETLDKVVDMSQATRLLQTSAFHQPQAKKVVFAARGEHEPEETTWVP
jgi:2-methylcitrate dehydratase PrpD